jgi:hypothetical protein
VYLRELVSVIDRLSFDFGGEVVLFSSLDKDPSFALEFYCERSQLWVKLDLCYGSTGPSMGRCVGEAGSRQVRCRSGCQTGPSVCGGVIGVGVSGVCVKKTLREDFLSGNSATK